MNQSNLIKGLKTQRLLRMSKITLSTNLPQNGIKAEVEMSLIYDSNAGLQYNLRDVLYKLFMDNFLLEGPGDILYLVKKTDKYH